MDDFDVDAALANLRRAEGPKIVGRKLPFEEQCAAFALLYGGAKNETVAKVFGISKVTVSYLNGCLQYDPSPTRSRLAFRDGKPVEETFERDHNRSRNPARVQHYENVAREFEALGEHAFNRRYLTPAIFDRVEKAKREIIISKGRVPVMDKGNPFPMESWHSADVLKDFEDFT